MFSQTFKVEEKKLPSFFSILPWGGDIASRRNLADGRTLGVVLAVSQQNWTTECTLFSLNLKIWETIAFDFWNFGSGAEM